MALTFRLPADGGNVVGHVRHVAILAGETFNSVGRQYDVGYYEMVEANPDLDLKKIPVGTVIAVPTQFILPNTEKKGLVINLAELRLYYYPPNQKKVVTYPVGIGNEGWDTPTGLTKIIKKVKNPTWIVPQSIWDERKKEGVILPKMILPGPDNPLGGYAFYLGFNGYRIHGAKSEDISGIGRRSSHGCVRLFPEDIERLFDIVPTMTPVRVVNEPYKAGQLDGKLYLEAHLPLGKLPDQEGTWLPIEKLIEDANKDHPIAVNWSLAKKVANRQQGVPTEIGFSLKP